MKQYNGLIQIQKNQYGEYKNYNFYIDTNYSVHIDGKATGIRAIATFEPKGFTNQEVTVTIKIKSDKGIKQIQKDNETKIELNGDKEYVIQEKAEKNSSYKYVVIDMDGTKEEKEVKVSKIDKIKPNAFTIQSNNTENGLEIIGNTTDAEETMDYAKSGIKEYRYYVTDSKNQTTEYTKNIIRLKRGTYSVYAKAIDNAGNESDATNVLTNINVTGANVIEYVSTTGNDETGDGSQEKPYATVKKAIDEAWDGDKIHILPGEYTLSSYHYSEYNGCGICDNKKKIEIFGENEKTILTYDASTRTERDGGAIGLNNPESIVRNLVYVYKPYGDSSYNISIFNFNVGTVKNVLFRISGKYIASYSYTYSTAGTAENCTFFHDKGNVAGNYQGGRNI